MEEVVGTAAAAVAATVAAVALADSRSRTVVEAARRDRHCTEVVVMARHTAVFSVC